MLFFFINFIRTTLMNIHECVAVLQYASVAVSKTPLTPPSRTEFVDNIEVHVWDWYEKWKNDMHYHCSTPFSKQIKRFVLTVQTEMLF